MNPSMYPVNMGYIGLHPYTLKSPLIRYVQQYQPHTFSHCLRTMASAGVIALDLARELLTLHPGRLALVVSHENITNNYYTGRDRCGIA